MPNASPQLFGFCDTLDRMKAIVGLGNPGPEYENMRHNVGRQVAQKIAKHFEFPELEESKTLLGIASKGSINKEKITIVMPDTFMNKSGKAVAALGVKPKDLVIIHDDSDLPLGTFKVSFAKNSGGHKGVESVMRAIKSKDFWRIRIGIQPPIRASLAKGGKKKRVDAMKLILQKFTPAEQLVVKKVQKKIIELLEQPLFTTTIPI